MTTQMVKIMIPREPAILTQGNGAHNIPKRGTKTRGSEGGKSEATTQGELGLLSRKR